MKTVLNLVRENIKALQPYASARDEFKNTEEEKIFLDANENPFNNGINRYPDPQQWKLKKELVTIKNVLPKQILLGNGSDEVLDLLFRAFCEPKMDNIITLPPTYGMYKVLADVNNIENREVLLTADFEPNLNEIISKTDKNTKLLFLCSPNNPTGNSFSEKSITTILQSFKGLVIIDEAYIDFSSKKSWLNKLNEFPNLVITQTLSKAYGMAGIRLGVCYASEEIIAILNKIKPPYNINVLTQKKALEKVVDQENVYHQIKKIIKHRKKLIAHLDEVSFVKKIYPTDANFVLIKVDDAAKRYNQLLKKGIVIRNRTTQPLCKNTLRLTVGTKRETKLLIQALKEL